MIIGTVEPTGDAVTPLCVRGPQNAELDVRPVLDTGFNGWLSLSKSEIESLQLEFREEVRYLLADGSEAISRVYLAEVRWLGRWKRIMVTELDGGALLGMALLAGNYLSIEVTPGGRVEVRSLNA